MGQQAHNLSPSRAEQILAHLKNPSDTYIVVVSHRGDWRYAPENSLAAIQHCIAMGVDVIELDDAVFAGLNLGKLDASAFVANASGTATSADQRIIYDTDSGQLFYDADGSLGGAAVLFGMVAGHPPLTGADFVVV